MDLGLIGILLIFFAIFIQILCMSFFKVKDMHIGLPSDFFKGRIKKEKDSLGFSNPIREPYREGVNTKLPWVSVKQISREVKTYPITKQEYPVKGEGTIQLSGTIQYRPSFLALYRYEEVSEDGIKNGLSSELDKLLGKELVEFNMEDAVIRRVELSASLFDYLTGPFKKDGTERRIFGKTVSYSEHSYGIEILKATIDNIEPAGDLKKSRENKQAEKYQRDAEKTEWDHYRSRMEELKNLFPNLSDKEILEAVFVWRGHATKEIKDFNLKGISEALEKIFGGGK